ncbi:MAG: hypothetical protein GY829_08780 [Gammaproteobacteria bacterium]|nr:hypothetical protein [Gammaproteobacteria bacterium]
MKLSKITLIILISLLATACGVGKYSGMSDKELAEKQRHCDSIPNKSAVFANGCEKVRKEIERRRE